MVIFEIIESPDRERLGEISIFHESFSLGSSIKANIVIEDLNIDLIHLNFELNIDGLLITSTEENYYNTNHKKIKGTKLHKENDLIQIGKTLIKIKKIQFENLSESFDILVKRRIQENPELEPLILQLQEELLNLEYKKDV